MRGILIPLSGNRIAAAGRQW